MQDVYCFDSQLDMKSYVCFASPSLSFVSLVVFQLPKAMVHDPDNLELWLKVCLPPFSLSCCRLKNLSSRSKLNPFCDIRLMVKQDKRV